MPYKNKAGLIVARSRAMELLSLSNATKHNKSQIRAQTYREEE